MRAIRAMIAVGMLWVIQTAFAQTVQEKTVPPSPAKADSTGPTATESAPDTDASLVRVKRIFVESFGDDAISKQVQAMVISSLTESKRFVVTENKERADAMLKGSGLEKASQELHSFSEATSAGGIAGGHSASVSGSFVNGTGGISGRSSGGFAGRSAAIEDSSTSVETVNDARIAVRLVDKDGDVIWATTQESKGAKYKGASADVADKVVKELLRAVQRLEKKPTDKEVVK